MKDIVFDEELQLEAYTFSGVGQSFPNHFHDYYVVGLIEVGRRRLAVNGREYQIGPGDLLLFNPGDNHACEQLDEGTLGYRGLNIKPEIFTRFSAEILGNGNLARFKKPAEQGNPPADSFRALHRCIMEGIAGLEKEELFLLLMQQVITLYMEVENAPDAVEPRADMEAVCQYIQQHYTGPITLEQLSRVADLNKYTLIRAFTKYKGITPYRYLETLRINRAKELLEQGVSPAEAALRTGFADQSHFTGFFSRFIGLPPGQYQAIFREGGR